MKDKLNKYVNEGVNYLKQNNFSQASSIFKKALKKFPAHQAINTYLIPSLIHQKKYEEALAFATQFHKKGNMLEHSSIYLGAIYFQTVQLDLALKYFDIALGINSNNCDALVNKAAVLNKLNRNSEAMKHLDRALKININNPAAYRNYASIYEDEFQLKKAEEYYLKALSFNPNDHQSLFALSHIQLSDKNYKLGWKNFEHRWLRGNLKYRYLNIPKLNNINNIEGKKILIWHEQGLGDTIQFSRYVRYLLELKAHIVFEVQEPLVDFFKNQFDCQITNSIINEEFDFQSPLLSLPAIFSNEKKYFEFAKPYFICKEEKYLFWKKELGLSLNKLNLGLTISGNTKQINEDRRKINLDYFIDILEYCKIYLIQKDISTKDKALVDKNDNIVFLGKNKAWQNFNDTSAILKNMDYLVSIDTSIIHLAGSMNIKSLLLLSKPAEWRWSQENENTPNWYSSIKILRQKSRRNWDSIKDDFMKIINNEVNNKFRN